MLTIRKAQMDALNVRLVRDFENLVVSDLAGRFPDQYSQIGEPRLRRLVRAGIHKAESYGIDSQDDVARVIEVMFEYGEDFDQQPDLAWPSKCLHDESLRGDEKAGLLVARLRARKRGARRS
jgi:hypothetical protein